MDPIGASCFSLNAQDQEKALRAQKKQEAKFQEIIVSCKSISSYETKSFKNLVPQIIAAAIAGSFHIVIGLSLSYSAILLPQLETETDFTVTKNEGSWVASILVVAVPIASPLGGFLMDRIGRLNTVKCAAIPSVIGWVMIACAQNVYMLLVGRLFVGFGSTLGSGPAVVYLTEIARADMRGSLISLAPSYTSLGMVLSYVKGWALDWRTVAWLANIYAVGPCLMVFLIPESPAWLVSKGRCEDALKSLNWFNKYQPHPEHLSESLSELQLAALQKEHLKKVEADAKSGAGMMQHFLKPTGYKPLLILFVLFFFQQFSGIYITLFYSIAFFQEVGSSINPYLASVMLGTLRCIMSLVNTYMLRTFRRRPLIICSALGMFCCMAVSAQFTTWIKSGTTTLTWVPVAAIGMYVVTSMVGLLSIPWTMTAELFPIEIRGTAHSITNAAANGLMFAAVQSYNTLHDSFGGVEGVQWFFAGISIAALIYAYIFMPETHGKKLSDITDYFNYNTVFLCQSKAKSQVNKNENVTRATPKDIVKSEDQNVKLLKNNPA